MANNISCIPNGPKNIATLFPTIDFGNVTEYFIEVLDDLNSVIATTTTNQVACCCTEDKIRLHFLNYLGTWDAVNFIKPKVAHETTFSEYQKGLPNILTKPSTGSERFNIQSNDTFITSTNCYGESQMLWLQELADSPKVFIEWKGTQGQNDSFLPIVITSKKFEKLKIINDFRYDFIIEFKLANEYLIIRN